MKKMIIMMAAVIGALAFNAPAAEVEYYTNITEQVQNFVSQGRYFAPSRVKPEEVATVDETMAASTNLIANWWVPAWAYHGFTKSSAKALEAVKDNECLYDVWKALVDNNKLYISQLARSNPEIYVNSIVCLPYGNFRGKNIEDYKRVCLQEASKKVKRQLRREGKSIIVKDGLNPVQDRLDALSTALDAPKMAGVKEAFAACGLDFKVNMATITLSDEDLAKLKDEVYNGDKPFNADNKTILLINLGVDEFNKFVEEYNK